jgi:hypothetical protein
MATRIQVRRDTATNWTTNDPTLAEGEIGFETDTGLFKIGANNTAWTSLAYAQVAGPAGPVGEVGPTGATGEQGAPGINGGNGENGINGLSAYEIWLNLGNSGSEQDFIDSLAGEDGVAGVDGVDGLNGANGAPGAPGPAGADGAPGADGQDGDPSDIQKLVFVYAASSPNTNSGNWDNPNFFSNGFGSVGYPDIYSQSFNIEKISGTSVIEINFDALFDISFDQNLGWGAV